MLIKTFVVLWLLASTAAQAQQRTFTLQVTEAELVVIWRAMEGAPYREVAPVIARLQQQLTAQAKPSEPPAPSPQPEK